MMMFQVNSVYGIKNRKPPVETNTTSGSQLDTISHDLKALSRSDDDSFGLQIVV